MIDALPDAGDIRFLKYRDAGSVLNAWLVFVRRNVRELVGGLLVIVGPAYLVISILSTFVFGRMFEDPAALAQNPFAVFGWSYFGLMAVSLLVVVVGQAAAGAYVRLYREGEAGEITPVRLWEETAGWIGPLVGMNVVVFVAMTLTALINFVPCLGQIAWLAIVLWASPRVAVALASRVVEADSIGEAWRRATVLVKGEWGFAFGTLFLVGVVTLVAFVVLAIPQQVVLWMLGVGFGEIQPTWPVALVQAPFAVLQSALYALPFVASFFIHGRLANDFDGTSLHDDLDALADRSAAARWTDEPLASTPPASGLDAPTTRPEADLPPSTPPAPEAPSDDAPPSGFRGGGFGGGA